MDDGKLVKEFFDQDFEIIKNNLALKINVASQKNNELLDRQNMQQIIAAMQTYQKGMVEFGQVLSQLEQNPDLLRRVIRSGMYSSTEAMRQILESFDMTNVTKLIFSEALDDGFTEVTGGGIAPATAGAANAGQPGAPALPQPAIGG